LLIQAGDYAALTFQPLPLRHHQMIQPAPESQLASAWRAFKRGIVPTLAAVGTGAVTGAGVGAALGEVVPGPGTVLGGIGGAVVGGIAGGLRAGEAGAG
jgi:hypothetical protein